MEEGKKEDISSAYSVNVSQQEYLRIQRYIFFRPELMKRIQEVDPSRKGTMVHFASLAIIEGLPDSIRAVLFKFPMADRLLGYIDQYIEAEDVIKHLKELVAKSERPKGGMGWSERFAEVRHARASFTMAFDIAREVIEQRELKEGTISEGVRTRVMLFLMEYVTDRPNLRASSVLGIKNVAFIIYKNLPDHLIDFCQRHKACEEHYRTLDPWVGENIDLIKL